MARGNIQTRPIIKPDQPTSQTLHLQIESSNKPVLVLRDSTERPEGVAAGTLKIVGTTTQAVKNAMLSLLNDPQEYHAMATAHNPYGDGHASERIVSICRDYLSMSNFKPR
jgi:UDP-N-acetylglucosamine 2-epimerase (non-hydrolysing)